MMLETLATIITVPGLSGLTFVAYRHPIAFGRVVPFVSWLAFLCATGMLCWNFVFGLEFHDLAIPDWPIVLGGLVLLYVSVLQELAAALRYERDVLSRRSYH